MAPNSKERQLRVVVASPTDVADERERLSGVVDALNDEVAPFYGCRLKLLRWEQDVRPGMHTEGAQGLIDSFLDIPAADVVIGIFWRRFGTPTNDSDSGTEHELRRAWQAWKTEGRPDVMVYFREEAYLPTTSDEAEQWARVLRFREEMPFEQLWWGYPDVAAFAERVRKHLNMLLKGTQPAKAEARRNGPWTPPTSLNTSRHLPRATRSPSRL